VSSPDDSAAGMGTLSADAEAAAGPPEAGSGLKDTAQDLAERFGLPALLVVTIVFFAVLPQSRANFATLADLRNLLADAAVPVVIALAALIPLIAGEFDFSIGLTMELSTIAGAGALTRFHLPLVVAILITLCVGLAIGSVNGFLVARLRLNSFITTFAMATIVTGVITLYVEGQSILVSNSTLISLGATRSVWLGVPRITFVVLAVCLVVAFVLSQTPAGRYIYALGSNRNAARLVGLRVPRLTFGVFLASGLLASTAAVLYISQQGAATPNTGAGYLLPAFAAVFLGSTAFQRGRFNVLGTIVAEIFVLVGSTGLVLAGLQPWVQDVFQGVTLVIALAISRSVRQRRG
jgi:ribose/xylose/arabinose/galactoside ABC-type transport system permease subunit